MNGKKSVTLRFTLSAEFIGNENATHPTIGTFIMPLNASDEQLYSVHLPGADSANAPRLPPESHASPSTLRSKGISNAAVAATPRKCSPASISTDGRHSGRPAMTDLLTPNELAAMLGMSVRTLANWRSTGKGPPYLKIGVEPPEGHQDRRKVRYQRQTAEQWALAHKYRRTVAR